jgi:hypothetical protein
MLDVGPPSSNSNSSNSTVLVSCRLGTALPQAGRGAGQKKRRISRAFAKSRTYPPADFFFSLGFFFVRVLGVSRQGEFKNTMQIFFLNAHVEKKRGGGSALLSRFRTLISRQWECKKQKHHENEKPFYKKIVSNRCYKTNDKKSNTQFLRFVLSCFFGVFRWVKFKNTIKQIFKK